MCGGGLRSWQKTDDPWVEHARWFPCCTFIKIMKGEEFIDSVDNSEACHLTSPVSNAPNNLPVLPYLLLQQLKSMLYNSIEFVIDLLWKITPKKYEQKWQRR
jgi:Inhibitor of Apoptosis domain